MKSYGIGSRDEIFFDSANRTLRPSNLPAQMHLKIFDVYADWLPLRQIKKLYDI